MNTMQPTSQEPKKPVHYICRACFKAKRCYHVPTCEPVCPPCRNQDRTNTTATQPLTEEEQLELDLSNDDATRESLDQQDTTSEQDRYRLLMTWEEKEAITTRLLSEIDKNLATVPLDLEGAKTQIYILRRLWPQDGEPQ